MQMTNSGVNAATRTWAHTPSPLAMDPGTFYALGTLALEIATEYLAELPGQPIFEPLTPAERELLLHQPLPEHGMPLEGIFDSFERHILPHTIGHHHPRFAAYVNSASAPIGMLAEFLAAIMNPSMADSDDHAAISLEHCTVRWLMEVKHPMGKHPGASTQVSLRWPLPGRCSFALTQAACGL